MGEATEKMEEKGGDEKIKMNGETLEDKGKEETN